MINQQLVLEKYQENYQLAFEDGHFDDSDRIAWKWTEEELMRLFYRYKESHQAAKQEAISKHLGY